VNGSWPILRWLDDKSDWLSPIAVKEVRQIVRAREFNYAFAASLVAALAIAFFGAADALTGRGTTGSWTFMALMVCLALLGLVVVPTGAFSALRNERMEQTLELITVTALSPRRVVIGKLLAQAVKLITLFAALAPFIAMSFLLGGVDFVTILLSLGIVFMWSVWTAAAFLFLSTLLKSRAQSSVAFGVAAVLMLMILGVSRLPFFFIRGGLGPMIGGPTRSALWWTLAIMISACLVTMTNLILLAENRLSVASGNRVTPLRIGFLVQFFLIVGWTLSFMTGTPRTQADAVTALGTIGGLHLAMVAMFTVTEDLIVPRRALVEMQRPSSWGWIRTLFYPGGGRGAAYVLTQMAFLLTAASLFRPDATRLRWFVAMCGYICFFTGVPAFIYRWMRPASDASLKLRVVVLLLLPLSMMLPDVLYYVFGQPAVLDLAYGRRHLVNPMRTLANWGVVESFRWSVVPFVMGATGLIAYVGLILLGRRMTAGGASSVSERSTARPADEEEPRSATALY
jgi:hypothetical protein